MPLSDLERQLGIEEFPRPSDGELEARYSAVPVSTGAGTGETVVVIGGGPSLTPEQVRQVYLAWGKAEVSVIGVNDAYRLAWWVDLLFAADLKWWRWHIEAVAEKLAWWSRCATIDPLVPASWGVQLLRNAGRGDGPGETAVHPDRDTVYTGASSASMAVQIAAKAGAKRVLLLGIDCKPGPDGRMHWFGDHPVTTPAYVFERYQVPCWRALAAAIDIEVINCTPGTALDVFPKMQLSEALER